MKLIRNILLVLIITTIVVLFCSKFFSPKLKSSVFLHEYSAQELTYFMETAFEQKGAIIKWEDTIRISLEGNYSIVDSLEIAKIIKEVSPLINVEVIQLPANSKNSNLLINLFKSEKDYESFISPGDLDNMAQGKTKYKFSLLTNQIIGAKIFVFHFADNKYWTLRHEFCHALGLPGHSKRITNEQALLAPLVFKSIEESDKWHNESSHFPESDKRSIKLLYSENLPIGLKLDEFKKQLK